MKLLIVLALVAVARAQDFTCKEKYGDYEDNEFCDYFWRCTRGEAKLMQCEDGHVFAPRLRGIIYPCDYIFRTNCTGRELLQDSKPGVDPQCLNQHGIFPDPDLCGTFYVCKNGIATRSQCAPGLHFAIDTRECVWPETANRGLCEERDTIGNFSCPLDAMNAIDANGNYNNNPTYIHPDDCRFFYVCLNGLQPSLAGCPDGTVFNDDTAKCDDPQNVPGCEEYYLR